VESHKGYKFGSGHRDSYMEFETKKSTPGPGAYHLKKDMLSGVSYSMGART